MRTIATAAHVDHGKSSLVLALTGTDPDRFAELSPQQQAEAQRVWAPFGAGARSCVGSALAEVELTVSLATLARRLDLAPARSGTPAAVGMVVVRPAGGVPFVVRSRAVRSTRRGPGVHRAS